MGARRAHRAVQPHQLLLPERRRALQHRAGTLVHRDGGAFLVVGERHDAQRQDFVDLGAVEQIAGLSGAICG
jgi:hypothetical protein